MFNRMYETIANKDYEERIRKTAQENFATRVERANRRETSILIRLGKSLMHLGFHMQRLPHEGLKDVTISR